ncbi:hypothetical protein NXW75_13330 [Bacteroides xylanisolvens]|nr:hypothetical protein [Bacteroides xylanisolvens]
MERRHRTTWKQFCEWVYSCNPKNRMAGGKISINGAQVSDTLENRYRKLVEEMDKYCSVASFRAYLVRILYHSGVDQLIEKQHVGFVPLPGRYLPLVHEPRL